MKKNTIYIFIVFIIMIFTAANVSADTITIAINPDSKPFKYYNEEGEFSGIDADVINALAEETDLDLEFIEMDFDKIIDAVKECQVDAAISALTLTENRAQAVDFTEPYILSAQSAFVRLKNDGIKDITDENIHAFGAKRATTAENTVNILGDRFGREVKLYTSYAELFKALENDEIDAAIADELLAKDFVDTYADMMTIGQPLSAEPYAIAVCPSNPELTEKLNAGLLKLQQDGKINEIILKNLER